MKKRLARFALAATVAVAVAMLPAAAATSYAGDSDSNQAYRPGASQSAHTYRSPRHDAGRSYGRPGSGGHWGTPNRGGDSDHRNGYTSRNQHGYQYPRYGHHGRYSNGGYEYRGYPGSYAQHRGYYCRYCHFTTLRYSLFHDHVHLQHGVNWDDIAAHIIFDPLRSLFTFGGYGHDGHHYRGRY